MTYTSTLTTAVAAMQPQRTELQARIDEYLQSGGKITQVPAGISGEAQEYVFSIVSKRLVTLEAKERQSVKQKRRAEVARFELEGDPRMCGDRWLETGKP